VVGEILGGVGYTVESAADGAVALLRAQETNFDVVLADLQMPGMHGAEFLHLLYRAPLIRMPAVIVLTGKATAENVQAYADLPVFATLRKPCAPEDLIQCVERAIERFRASGPG
jgi:CheY-like chemotaxis protein